MSFLHLFGVSSGMPRFFACLLSLWVALLTWAAGDIATYVVVDSDYSATRDALLEVIEAEGLVVGAILPFNQMLQRTGGDRAETPFQKAEIVQFCSSALAWQMVQEAPEQLALCPLSIAIYNRVAGDQVTLAYRRPGDGTPGRRQAADLLGRIARRTVELARLRW